MVKKQYCGIYYDGNPHKYQEQLINPQRVAVWCALWTKCLIDPYFLKMKITDYFCPNFMESTWMMFNFKTLQHATLGVNMNHLQEN